MSSGFRHLILWLLLLALPVQGWAMVTMQHCGAGHDATVQVASHASHHASADHHALHDHSNRVAVGHSADRSLDGVQIQDDPSAAQCSACASCCFGAALPTHPPTLGSSLPRATLTATLAAPALSFFTSGPDRPPRNPLV